MGYKRKNKTNSPRVSSCVQNVSNALSPFLLGLQALASAGSDAANGKEYSTDF